MSYLTDAFSAALWGTEPPNEPEWITWKHISMGQTHCKECLALDNCWFAAPAAPNWPHHMLCHCVLVPLSYAEVMSKVRVTSDYSKYDPYLFNVDGSRTHHKEEMLASWGYTVDDAVWLQQEIEQQGWEKYIAGEYTLGKLDKHGQRINIRIEIPRKAGEGTASFVSGWMVRPGGLITLNTPYGGE